MKFRELPAPAVAPGPGIAPAKPAEALYDLMPADHRLPYDMEELVARIVDGDDFLEFQPDYAPEMLCANCRLAGRAIAVIANRRGFLKSPDGPRIGGIVYTESARKVAYFVENAERAGTPLIYFQDVSGFHGGRGSGERAASFAPGPKWWRPWPAPRCRRSC